MALKHEVKSLLITLKGHKSNGVPLSVKKQYEMESPPDVLIDLGSANEKIYCHRKVLSSYSPIMKRLVSFDGEPNDARSVRSDGRCSDSGLSNTHSVRSKSIGGSSPASSSTGIVLDLEDDDEGFLQPSRKYTNQEPLNVLLIEAPHPRCIKYMVELFYLGSLSFPPNLIDYAKRRVIKTLDSYGVDYTTECVEVFERPDESEYECVEKWPSVSDCGEVEDSEEEISPNRHKLIQEYVTKRPKTPENRSRKTEGENVLQQLKQQSVRRGIHSTSRGIDMAEVMQSDSGDSLTTEVPKSKNKRNKNADRKLSVGEPVIAVKQEELTPMEQMRMKVSRKPSEGRKRVIFSPDDSDEENKSAQRPLWKSPRSPTPFRVESEPEQFPSTGKKRKRKEDTKEEKFDGSSGVGEKIVKKKLKVTPMSKSDVRGRRLFVAKRRTPKS